MIVDCHTHWARRFRKEMAGEANGWLHFMEQHGITHSVVMPLLGLLDDTQIQTENDGIADVCATSNGRMIPFCTVNPSSEQAAVAELRRCLKERKHRGLKIHPWLQGASPSTNTMDQLCELAADYHIPILFHDGTPCYSLPSQIAMLAKRHPTVSCILGHCGLFEHWREAIAAMSYAENLYGCLCGPYPAALQQIIRHCDGNRLLWGSDYGFGDGSINTIGYRFELFELLDLDATQQKAILAGNPTRLFNLNPPLNQLPQRLHNSLPLSKANTSC